MQRIMPLSFGLLVTLCADAQGQHRSERHEEELRLPNGDVKLAATLLWPSAEGPVPGVVIIHGSGDSDRENPWTQAYAKALQDRGIAVLYPDERGCGKSGGDWHTASFQDLASDASAALRHLAAQPGIDTARIGVMGFSQGGYPASIVAADDPLCRFAVSVSGGVLPLMDQMLSEVEAEAEAEPRTGDVEALHRAYACIFDFAAHGGDWQAVQDTLNVLRQRGAYLEQTLSTVPPDQKHWAVKWIHATGNFDPWPSWSRTEKPVLFLYGGRDASGDTRASMQRITTEGAKKSKLSVIFFAHNAHTHFRDDALDFIRRWIADRGVD
jgi:pimeloyl-ACP methyl ester carboxylesterase